MRLQHKFFGTSKFPNQNEFKEVIQNNQVEQEQSKKVFSKQFLKGILQQQQQQSNQIKVDNEKNVQGHQISRNESSNFQCNSFRRRLIPKQNDSVSSKINNLGQGDMIQFLQKQNEKLLEENEKKQKIIDHLLESKNISHKVSKVSSPVHKQMNYFQPPRSVENEKGSSQVTRLPKIKTPQPYLKHRLITKETNETTEETERNKQLFSPTTQQNLSFGKQLNFDIEETKEFQVKETKIGQNYLLNQQLCKKQYSQPSLLIKTNFSKPLLKLPEEFHLKQRVQKKIVQS